MTTALIVGAGFSSAAGAPLAAHLFSVRPRYTSRGAWSRYERVWASWAGWKERNPDGATERFVQDAADDKLSVPYAWVVELIGAVLASTLSPIRSPWTSARYAQSLRSPLRATALEAFWGQLQSESELVALVSLNYDLSLERIVRPRPMKASPGFFYGGLPTPQVAIGSGLFSVSNRELPITGRLPLMKLHGSLNWVAEGSRVSISQDFRAAFRSHRQPAIIPPRTEKDVPVWLRPVWEAALGGLRSADRWVVVGYSLPPYDSLVARLLQEADGRDTGRRVRIFARSEASVDQWRSLLPGAEVTFHGPVGEGAAWRREPDGSPKP